MDRGEAKGRGELLDAISFLCGQRRTGGLQISRGERVAEIFIQEGKLVHAHLDDYRGMRALDMILAWDGVEIHFTPQKLAEEKTIDMGTAEVLALLARQAEGWKRILADWPVTLDTVLRLQPQASGTVKLKKDDWDILAMIDGKRSLEEIARNLDTPPLELVESLRRFYDAGLIGSEVEEGAEVTRYGGDFLSTLEKELNLAIGPLAPIVMEEALDGRRSLTSQEVERLLVRLAEAIPDEKKRGRFLTKAQALAASYTPQGDGG